MRQLDFQIRTGLRITDSKTFIVALAIVKVFFVAGFCQY